MSKYVVIKPTFVKDLNSYTAIVRMILQTSPGGSTSLCSYRILSTLLSGNGICSLTKRICSAALCQCVFVPLTVTGGFHASHTPYSLRLLTLRPSKSNMQTGNKCKERMTKFQMRRINAQYLKGLGEKKDKCFTVTAHLSHLDALHRLVDGLEQSPVLWVLVAVFIGKHVGQRFHVAVEVLLWQRILLETHTYICDR